MLIRRCYSLCMIENKVIPRWRSGVKSKGITVSGLWTEKICTPLLDMLNKPGGIVSVLRHQFKPSKQCELPSPRVLRHALMSEADNIQDHQAVILFTFGSQICFYQKGIKHWCFWHINQITNGYSYIIEVNHFEKYRNYFLNQYSNSMLFL